MRCPIPQPCIGVRASVLRTSSSMVRGGRRTVARGAWQGTRAGGRERPVHLDFDSTMHRPPVEVKRSWLATAYGLAPACASHPTYGCRHASVCRLRGAARSASFHRTERGSAESPAMRQGGESNGRIRRAVVLREPALHCGGGCRERGSGLRLSCGARGECLCCPGAVRLCPCERR